MARRLDSESEKMGKLTVRSMSRGKGRENEKIEGERGKRL